MLKDRMVRLKLARNYKEQRPQSYVGKVDSFSDCWVVIKEAKMLLVCRNQPNGLQMDVKTSPVVIPRDQIESIRVLPDTFDINDIQVTTDGQILRMLVKGAADCYLGELGEG